MIRPLALTDQQFAELKRAAGLLPPPARDPFLHAIGARLAGAEVTDDAISAAIVATLSNIGITTSVFLCDDKSKDRT